MMIRILQGAVVAIFVGVIAVGLVFLFAGGDMAAYGQFVGIILPVFFGSVVPALIGTPLTEAVRNLSKPKDG